ncbi:hypothetical protein [Hyphobacterium marinum]|uniref:Uncharacterized protein n=1 Tax=Hyphobacterium marinum TaxID=3116574 RepID=A0ABU7M1F5_9PROT|nr:hypothetical protein [Hyphobacterium sp. Y6023]MEE2567639.1 hypothetical protein [Hyphobacterium sp. Y6023]
MRNQDRPSSITLVMISLRDMGRFLPKAGLQAAILSLPLAAALSWLALLATQIAGDESKPFGTYILVIVAAILVAIPAQSALLRRALRGRSGPLLGLELGGDEVRLAIVALLIGILGFTVLGAAGLGLVAILAALDLAARSRAGAPAIDSESPETALPVLGEYFGNGDWGVAVAVIALFTVFAIWFCARLSLAYAATIARQKVQALSSFSLTRGRWIATALVMALALLPGLGLRYLALELARGEGAASLGILFALEWLAAAVTLLLTCAAGMSLYRQLGGDDQEPVPS